MSLPPAAPPSSMEKGTPPKAPAIAGTEAPSPVPRSSATPSEAGREPGRPRWGQGRGMVPHKLRRRGGTTSRAPAKERLQPRRPGHLQPPHRAAPTARSRRASRQSARELSLCCASLRGVKGELPREESLTAPQPGDMRVWGEIPPWAAPREFPSPQGEFGLARWRMGAAEFRSKARGIP